MKRRLAAAITIAVAAAACSSSPPAPTGPAGPTGTTTTVTATTTTVTTTSTTEQGTDGDLRALADLGTIELVDPAPAGVRPTLAWQPVAEADHYRVVVLDGDGDPYWAWLGTDTSVPFGGAETDDGILASVHEPMTWMVVAVDAEGRTIAISDPGDLPG